MRILVISDSHGNVPLLNKIIKTTSFDALIFLGDGAKEMNNAKKLIDNNKPVYVLLGNNDFFTEGHQSLILNLENKTIFCCHGHNYYVKSSKKFIKEEAIKNKANIVLYGHTHKAEISYEDGIYLINPGSLYSPKIGYKSVLILDIGDYGVMPIIKKV